MVESIVPLQFGIPGGPELLVILLIAVLLFGANKIPKLARSTGEAMGEFQKGREEVEQELKEMRDAGASQEEIERTREEYEQDDSVDYETLWITVPSNSDGSPIVPHGPALPPGFTTVLPPPPLHTAGACGLVDQGERFLTPRSWVRIPPRPYF